MALIVEDGSGSNPSANSYISIADLRLYADSRGVELPEANKDVEALVHKAMNVLESPTMKFKGYKTSDSQPLEWPRRDVWDVERDGKLSPNDEIPRLLEQALAALVFEQLKEEDETRDVVSRKIGDVQIVYSSDKPKQHFVDSYSSSKALLAPLRDRSGFFEVTRG